MTNATDMSTDNIADISDMLDTETSACTKTIKGDLEQTINVNKNMKEVVEKSKVTKDIYDAFHSLENKLIACRAENNKKIESLNSVIVDMQKKSATQEANRLESEKETRKELQKMNDRVQIVENKLRENGIKVDCFDNSCKLL